MSDLSPLPPEGEFLLYTTDDGQAKLEVRLSGETIWLSQKQMADLFQKDVRTINEHIQNIYEEQELVADATIRNFRIVQTEGKRQVERDTIHYNLEFAELQALGRKPMYMADWISKLDDFMRISDRDILSHAGSISHDQALKKAQIEFEKYRAVQINAPSPVEGDFDATIKQLKQIKPPHSPRHGGEK